MGLFHAQKRNYILTAIIANKKGRRIELRTQFPLPGIRADIPGAYQNSNGNWTVPLNLETCKLLKDKFGSRLQPTDELRRWVRTVQSHRRYMARLASSEDAQLDVLPRVAPRLAKAMKRRKYQRVGTRFVADNHATLIADEPGLGKTLIAMGGILEAQIPGPYLVVAPKTAANAVWQREIKRWLPRQFKAITLPEGRIARERKLRYTPIDKYTWIIVHPEIVMVQAFYICEKCGSRTPWKKRVTKILSCKHPKTTKTKKVNEPNYARLLNIRWGAIIADESHEILIRRSGVPTQRRLGMDLLRENIRPDGMALCLSGTPWDSKPHQLWGTLNWLDPKQYSAFHRWAELYWEKTGYSGFEIGEFRKDREQLLWGSLDSIALRRTKLEVAKDLPPKMEVGTPLDPSDENSPIGIWLEMEGEQEKAYKQMELQSSADLESGRLEAITALAELTRLKQLACSYGDIHEKKFLNEDDEWEYRYKYIPKLPSNKFNWTVENLEEWGYPRNPITKVVIVSFYTGLLNMFAKQMEQHFKVKRPLCTFIRGGQSSKERNEIIKRFNQHDNEHVMMLNVRAGGTAITIDSADRMIFISETRIPDQQNQAEDRIHRVSNPRQCMYYYLRSLGTIDVGTAIVNKSANEATHRLLDKRRGVEYLREVISLST